MNLRRGFALVLSAPSGAGKTTLMRALVEKLEGLTPSVSTTTRAPRSRERNGVDYHFVDDATFQAQVKEQRFLEWAEVFGHYYGTSRDVVEEMLEAGRDVVLDIDWQGARQVCKALDARDTVSVFIMPPSRESLLTRLTGRGQDSEEVIAGRMAKATDEMSHWAEFDYLLINDDLFRANAKLEAIVMAERLKRERAGSKVGDIVTSFDLEFDQ